MSVGGALANFASHWATLRPAGSLLNVIKDGYVLPLSKQPPQRSLPIHFPTGNQVEVARQVKLLHQKRAIEPVLSPMDPGFYSRLFVVPKASGDFRPVIDLSTLNRFLTVPKFRMETPKSIQLALAGSRWAVKLDLSDAYFHVLIHPQARPFLRFTCNGQAWQFRALPFGLATAPFVFTWILRPLLTQLRAQGIHIHAFLDDWLVHHSCRFTLQRHIQIVLDSATRLGFQINLAKSILIPQRTLVYLGMEFDLTNQLVRPPMDKCEQLISMIQEFRMKRQMPAILWARLLGKLGFIGSLVPRGRLQSRPLQSHLKSYWDFNWAHRQQPIPMTPVVDDTLRWWTSLGHLREGRPLQSPPSTGTLFTDASQLYGWGAHLDGQIAGGPWEDVPTDHINLLEMKAVLFALHAFADRLRNRSIVIASDNTTVLGYLRNQGGTKSHELTSWTSRVFQFADSINLTFTCRHVPGKKNVLADQVSRQGQAIQTEWMLHPKILRMIWTRWSRPRIDAFATCLTRQLQRYFSPVPDPHAEAVDALSQDWTQHSLYMFPPFPLIPATLRKLRKPHAPVVLVIPWTPHAVWFPDLLDLSQQPGFQRMQLPQVTDLLSQPLSDELYPHIQTLNLHACWLPQQR